MKKLLLLGLIACILSILLMTAKVSAKELRINLTESLDMSSNDKKPKDLTQAKPPQKAKSDKTKEVKPEKPKPKSTKPTTSIKTKPAPTVKAKPSPTASMKTKWDTVKNSTSNTDNKKHNSLNPKP